MRLGCCMLVERWGDGVAVSNTCNECDQIVNETYPILVSVCVVVWWRMGIPPKGQDRDGGGVLYRAFCTKTWRDGHKDEGP